MLGEVGRIDIYRVDCVNASAQKDPIDFRRCVNGNTIEGRDRVSCRPVEDLGHAYCGQAQHPAAFMTRNRTRPKGEEKAPIHGPEVATGYIWARSLLQSWR